MAEYITVEGMQRLQRRIINLTEERPLVVEQVQIARAMGDLSENAEYHSAKERQTNIEKELAYLNSRIAKLQILDPAKIAKDAVRFGAYITIKDEDSGKILTYHMVGEDEVYDRDDGIIPVSYVSPLGKAMLGKKVNEAFIVKAPIGNLNYKVLEIK